MSLQQERWLASMGRGTQWMLVLLSVVLSWSCATARGPSSALGRMSLAPISPTLERTVLVMGAVPLLEALRELTRLELMKSAKYPPIGADGVPIVQVPQLSRGIDLIRCIEEQMGWVWCGDGFIEAPATHPLESPDAFGRPMSDRVSLALRPQLRFRVRAFRTAAGANFNTLDITASSVFSTIDYRVPDGLKMRVGSESERIYYEPLVFVQGDQPVVQQQRRTANAGFTFDGLAARLPSMGFRVSGTVSLSAFTGGDSARVSVSIPCEIDAERGRWVTFYVASTSDVNLRLALLYGVGVRASATADQVVFQVRVDD